MNLLTIRGNLTLEMILMKKIELKSKLIIESIFGSIMIENSQMLSRIKSSKSVYSVRNLEEF